MNEDALAAAKYQLAEIGRAWSTKELLDSPDARLAAAKVLALANGVSIRLVLKWVDTQAQVARVLKPVIDRLVDDGVLECATGPTGSFYRFTRRAIDDMVMASATEGVLDHAPEWIQSEAHERGWRKA